MYLYKYSGPVKRFQTIINSNWEGYTYAVSEAKARSNLSFQYKKQHGLKPNVFINLVGRVKMEPIEQPNKDQITIAEWLKSENKVVEGLR